MSAAPPLNPIGTASPTPAAPLGVSWLAGAWWAQLQPGSWRGRPFVMDTAPTKAGRRIAEHEYPYKDVIWPEDLGKLPRRYQMQAFLVGDDCYQQQIAMIAACEQAGPGTLVHPTLGSLQVVLLEFSTTVRRDRGRYVEVNFEFVDATTAAPLPSIALATGPIVNAAAAALNAIGATSLANALAGLSPTPTAPTAFISQFAQLAVNAVNDPARALGAVTGLVGYYGRYSMGNAMTTQPETATVDSALADSVDARQEVIDNADALTAAGDDL